MRNENVFLTLWTLAVAAAATAFVLQLSMRVRSVELGYDLGRAHAHLERLREVRHVLELELSSHKTPERVEFVARTLLGMSEPDPERVFPAGAMPGVSEPALPAASASGAAAAPTEEAPSP